MHAVDTASGFTNERDQLRDHIATAELSLNPSQGGGGHQAFPEQNPKGPAHGIDLLVGNARPPHADDIDGDDCVNALLNHERWHVLGGDRASAEQREPANTNKLMDGAIPGEIDVVAN